MTLESFILYIVLCTLSIGQWNLVYPNSLGDEVEVHQLFLPPLLIRFDNTS